MGSKMETKLAKVGINQEAEASIERMVSLSNEGFLGGRVTKTSLLSWLIPHVENHLFEQVKESIRAAHFDEVRYLEGRLDALKKAKRNGEKVASVAELFAEILPPRPSIASEMSPKTGDKVRD